MTRSELQVLREDVAAGLNHLALLRIDAELAKPPRRAVGACRVTCKCGKPATWAGEFCQICWEAFCAGEWWRLVEK